MTQLNNFADAERVLMSYMPLTAQITGKDITLARTEQLMAAIGNPQHKLRIIHLAGTSGKTSTTYYISSLLITAGYKVGTTVSPHVDSIAERLQIGLLPLDEATYCAALTEFIELIETLHIQPTYFELLIGFAYWYFAKINVDFAVIETGLGGLHDSTNVAQNPDKVCVITDIGYDHMHVLGNTLEQIATQKAGIIHAQNQVYMYDQAEEVMAQIRKRCEKVGAKLNIIGAVYADNLTELPLFQQRNAHLAHAVYEALTTPYNLPRLSLEQTVEALSIQVPARMDQRHIDGKIVVMDGAHNGQKMRAFTEGFVNHWPEQKAAVLLGLKSGKDYAEVLPLLYPLTTTLIITEFLMAQDTPVTAIDSHELAVAAKEAGFKNVIVEADPEKAYSLLLQQPEELLVITGSFYLIGQLRHTHAELRNC